MKKIYWTDDEVIVVDYNGAQIRVLNSEASKRIYAEILAPGTPIPADTLIPVDKLNALLAKMNVETEEEVKPEDEEEVKPEDEEEVKPEDEEEEPFVIEGKYASFLTALVNDVDFDNLTEDALVEAIDDNIFEIQEVVIDSELANAIENVFVKKNGTCSLTDTQIKTSVIKVLSYYRNLTPNDTMFLIANKFNNYSSNKMDIKELFKFFESVVDHKKLDELKFGLYFYVVSHFIDNTSDLFEENFGLLPTPTQDILDRIKNYSRNLYYLVVDSMSEKAKAHIIFSEDDLKRVGQVRDPFGKIVLDIYTEKYATIKKDLASEESEEMSDEEEIKPRGPLSDADDEEEIKPSSDEDDEDEDEDEEVYGVTRLGKFLEPAKKPSAYTFAVTGIATMFASIFGINPKTVWFYEQYSGLAKFIYTSLTVALAASGLIQLAIYFANKKGNETSETFDEDEDELSSEEEFSYSDDDDEENEDEDEDSNGYHKGYRRFS